MNPVGVFFLYISILSVSTGALLWAIFYLRYKEKIALIERGINPSKRGKDQPKPFSSLKVGFLFTGTGIGLLLAFLIYTVGLNNMNKDNVWALYVSLTLLGGGLGFIYSYRLEMKHWKQRDDIDIDV